MSNVHICGREVPQGARHICAFVRSRDEHYEIMAPFVREGLTQGERVIQIVNPGTREDHVRRMARGGADVDGTQASGQLSVLAWADTYLKDGHFDMDRMIDMLDEAVADRKARGFPLLRAMGDMDWALQGAPGSERLLEYETRVNLATRQLNDCFVCFYDVNKFPANLVVDLMRTHPAVIIGGVYHENPFYVQPEELLRELAARGKAKAVA